MLGQGLIDPSDITEAVDVSPGLIQSIRDLLGNLGALAFVIFANVRMQSDDRQLAEMCPVLAHETDRLPDH